MDRETGRWVDRQRDRLDYYKIFRREIRLIWTRMVNGKERAPTVQNAGRITVKHKEISGISSGPNCYWWEKKKKSQSYPQNT